MLGRRRLVGLGLVALAIGTFRGNVETLFAQGEDADGATGMLTGQVGTPLAGAVVMLLSSSLEAGDLTLTADGDGRFSLSPAPVGLYDVQADRDGFRTGTLGAVPVRAGEVSHPAVVLEPRIAGDGGY
jgi:hypothetical protein